MDAAREADALQQFWLLPFELVDLTPERPHPTLAVTADDGALFLPTDTLGPAEAEAGGDLAPAGRRFAYAIAARLPNREQIVASASWALEAARERFRTWTEKPAAWLLRVEDRGEDRPHEVLVLRGPEPVRPRVPAEGPTALLVDLGMVLARFDRDLFATNFLTMFGQPAPLTGLMRMEELRLPLERGELLADEFLDQGIEHLNLAPPDRAMLGRVWGSIMSPNRPTVALVRRTAELPNVAVVVVSNTDPITIRYLQEDLGLADLLQSLAASCQDGVNPKGADASLWLRGRNMARLRLGAEPALAIAVDDVRSYLRDALESGAADRAIHYRHFAQFRYELGACGLYLPQARPAA